jgi:hypothetical protein
MTDSNPRITFQTAFGDDGDVELAERSVETSLEDFGATVDHRERATRRARPAASEFGVDDRPEVQSFRERESDQSRLVADADDEQRTLTGRAARQPPLYEHSSK